MKTLKQIAGDLLLYFYKLQRQDKLEVSHVIVFDNYPGENINLNDKSEFGKTILNLADNSSIDTYNGLKYLEEKSFINFKEDGSNAGILLHGLRITAYGLDIIEGIERGEKEKNEFHVVFNIKLAENVNIESLIKAELGSLIKASLI